MRPLTLRDSEISYRRIQFSKPKGENKLFVQVKVPKDILKQVWLDRARIYLLIQWLKECAREIEQGGKAK